MPLDGARREEILDMAALMFASTGLRTSLKEIADACGILPGSLYHHFDSKEAIIVELVHRYRTDLDRIAKEATDALHSLEPRPVEHDVVALGEQIAECAVRHRAALLLSLYEPPTGAGQELAELTRQMPIEIAAAMLEILRKGRAAGEIRSGIDLTLLAERICDSMLHVGVGVSHRLPGAQRIPALKCRVLLRGVATRAHTKPSLDRSLAMRAARGVVAGWREDDATDRVANLRTVARTEFGRRGYEATTIRDISAAAGLSTASVYRAFSSKEELLESIMRAFDDNVTNGWVAVLQSRSSALEKLDALMWVNTNVLDRFRDEYKIQLAWLRQAPPNSPNLALSFPKQLRQMNELLGAGMRAGELHIEGASADLRARAMIELIWMPENIVRTAGLRAAHSLARDTVLRGAATRS